MINISFRPRCSMMVVALRGPDHSNAEAIIVRKYSHIIGE